MKIFYWLMGILIAGTFMPSVLCLGLSAATGADLHARRARAFWNYSRLFFGFGANILIWGHVVVGLWHIWH